MRGASPGGSLTSERHARGLEDIYSARLEADAPAGWEVLESVSFT
jgi:hypothetical protein